ncbi:hypothetical protein Nepgr_018798 [Nepenthes gracilis]|uniref:Uncharacterized protein n=1 Tax=Nepenthes gracilis TaxID=150966 RepID=A0AAD3STQ9_NEPGR|nr:hypothetical protein Nepgr_018798 [Nepenthes gracilis]
MQVNHSPHFGSSVDQQKVAVDSDCSAKPFTPLRADCDAELVEGIDIQCPQSAEQLAVDGLAMPLISCSPILADSLGLDAICLVVDPEHPNANLGDQLVQYLLEANMTLYSSPSLDFYSG